MRILFLTLVFILALLFLGLVATTEKCGYDASMVRIVGQNLKDKKCDCYGIVGGRPFWKPIEADLLSPLYCYGIVEK